MLPCHHVRFSHKMGFDQLYVRPCQYKIDDALHGRTTSKFVYFLDSTGKLLILQNFFITFNKNKHRDFSVNLSIFLIYTSILLFSRIHIFSFFQQLVCYTTSSCTERSKKVYIYFLHERIQYMRKSQSVW